jgi:hypothetical protein
MLCPNFRWCGYYCCCVLALVDAGMLVVVVPSPLPLLLR